MKSILLLIDSFAGFDSRLQAALDVARGCGAHLTCLQASDYPAWAIYDGISMPMTAIDLDALNRSIEEGRTKERAAVEARLSAEDVPWSWHAEADARFVAIARHASLHDLIVLGAKADTDAGDVLLSTRTPALVIPEGARAFDVTGPALVAWNSSPEAAAALKGAVPLLKHASAVHLVEVGDADRDPPIEAAARYLSRHGVHANVERVPAQGNVSATIAATADRLGAAWVTMGAYGRSRWRETLLGGVTRGMLKDPKRPLLLAH